MLLEDFGLTGSSAEVSTGIGSHRLILRHRIMAVAKRSFARYGYERVSLQDIAAGAHVDWDDLQSHFRDKDSLLAAVLDEGWKGVLPRLSHLESSSITAHTAILGVLSLMTTLLQQDQDLFRLLLLEGRLPDPEGGEMGFSVGYRRFMQLCRDLVLRGQRDGSFRPTLHPHVAASILVGALEGMLRDRLIAAQERVTTPYTGNYVMPAFDALVDALKK